jgi:hypothetical protein
MTFTSGADSELCDAGQVMVVADGEVFQPGEASFLRGWRVSGDPCGRLEGVVILTLAA